MRKFRLIVGIAAYNEEANIGSLVNSLLAQKGNNFILKKIIVADDASTDGTYDRLKTIKDRRLMIIRNRKRKGQSERLNQIKQAVTGEDDGLLILEADTLPRGNRLIERLIEAAGDNDFNMVVGEAVPYYSKSEGFIRKVMRINYQLKREIFKKALEWPNLYLCNGQCPRLLSTRFINSFEWNKNFHEDSNVYREASKGMIIMADNAISYFQSVGSIGDYIKQSGKFIKARKREKDMSNIYSPQYKMAIVTKVIVKYLLRYPGEVFCYIILMTVSRLYNLFTDDYHGYWSVYETSKIIKKC